MQRAIFCETGIADVLQMADLKENIENEVQAAHEEYLKMDAHINLYMKEMEQVL